MNVRDVLYYAQLAAESVVGVVGIRSYEEPPYTVIARVAPAVEVRRYEKRLAAEIEVEGSGDEASNRAFSALFEYIAGANEAAGEKIAMTTPVEVERRSEKVAMTVPVETARDAATTRMRFFLPSKYAFGSAPRPRDARIRLVEVPGDTLAVLRFSGTASREAVARRERELLQALDGSDWRAEGEPVTLFYDAPFTLPFVRRNEAAVRAAPRERPGP